ncbi:MAG: carboxypeptidase regulatory-like domain-containing protein [Sandaracinaceae bacterium]
MVRSRIDDGPFEPELTADTLRDATRLAVGVRGAWRRGIDALSRIIDAIVSPGLVRSTRRALESAVATGVLLGAGCGGGAPVEVEGIVRDGRTGEPVAGAHITSDDGASSLADGAGRFTIVVEESSERTLTASAAGRCPATQTIDARGDVAEVTFHLYDAITVDGDHLQVGFDAEVRIEASARCTPDGALRWAQISGPELADDRIAVEDGGTALVVHTPPLTERATLDERFGIIALDRSQRGDYRFEVTGTFGGEEASARARVLSAATSAGVYQVPTGTDVYFNGGPGASHRWTLDTRPEGSEAVLHGGTSQVAFFRPDRYGTYTVAHTPGGREVSLQAGPYEDVPRDCGRPECHQAEDEGWERTAHARTFRRGLEGALGPEFGERCWSCHATGVEPGVDNGGLHATAARVGWDQPPPDASLWETTPRLVRRHGSVWCSACHGPGRIVPPQYHWQYGAKYQVGVCARCHDVDEDDPDANHRSPHVDEWRLSPMSRFVDRASPTDPAVREACAHCHSAQGFVEWRRRDVRVAPDPLTVTPIACPVCHDPHGGVGPRGLRIYESTDPLSGELPLRRMGAGAVCATCHRASALSGPDAAPHAPQTNLLVGVGARLATATEGGVHRAIADTCVRCHMTRPEPDDPAYGAMGGHTFSVVALRGGEGGVHPAACAPCHGDEAPSEIGARDWNGDGTSGSVASELDDALLSADHALSARIAALEVHDSCATPRVAASVAAHDARLHLVDARGGLLGDCDGDGRITGEEHAITIAGLPRALADAAYDLRLVATDGSHGAHNPTYAFAILSAVSAQLQ